MSTCIVEHPFALIETDQVLQHERNHLDVVHHITKILLGESLQRVLDLATGTGIWAIEIDESCKRV
jgi:hypothetical protein